MDVADDVGLGQRQDVGVALEVVAVVGERLAAVVGLAELVPLDQGAHRAVDHQDALAQRGVRAPRSRRAGARVSVTGLLSGRGAASSLGSASDGVDRRSRMVTPPHRGTATRDRGEILAAPDRAP